MKEQLLLNEVAKELGDVKAYQISYAISCGQIPEPTLRISNKRIFTRKDLDGIKKYFAARKVLKEAHE